MQAQFIVLAPNEWQGQWMNRQQIFSRIGQQSPVLYSTGPLFLWQRHSAAFGKLNTIEKVFLDHNVNVLTPHLFSVRLVKWKFLDNIACTLFGKLLAKHSPAKLPIILYIFHPSYYHYAAYIKHDFLVFHAYDDYSKQSRYSQELLDLDHSLAQKADLLIASSNSIKNRYQALCHRQDILFVPNGVDFNFFSRKPDIEPLDLAAIPSPRVSYVGSINAKVDLELLLTLVEYFPFVSFVMVGDMSNLDNQQLAQFETLAHSKNVYFLGPKKLQDISAYMHYVDINIMLYKVSDKVWASSGYPLKMHEYLAVGKPIISCDIEAVREFSEVINIAKNSEQWKQLIHHLLSDKANHEMKHNRQAVARINTWEQRVALIKQKITQLLTTKNTPS